MSRFRKDPDPRFWRLNRSIEFDWRLAPYDIDQSQAHARGAARDRRARRGGAGADRRRARARSGRGSAEHGFEFEEADEDIHMAIERLLGEEIGPLAGKLHTGRSRNDQVATDVAMVVQAHSLRAIELAGAAMERLLELAERHRDWPMPGYTHLQRAQPVYLGHHLLAYFWMLARDVLRFQFALDSAGVMPLGSGALAGVNWEIDRARRRRRPRLRARQPQLDRRRLQPRLRPRLPRRRLDLRDAPLAARLGDRDLVEQRVRLLRARRVLLLGVEHHAAEEEPRLGRAAAGEEPARRRRLRLAARHDARAAAHLRQGHAGGQGAAVRRDRHGRALPRRDRGDAGRDRVRPRAAARPPPATRCWRRPRSPTCSSARACPSARRTGSSAASSATRSSSGEALSELTPEELRRALRAPRRLLLRGAEARAAGWSRSGSRAAPARRRWRGQIELARETLDGGQGAGSPKSDVSVASAATEQRLGGDFFDRSVHDGRARADRLPPLLRGPRRRRSSRPRATSATTRPATPTSG